MLFYVLATSEIISGRVPTCNSTHSWRLLSNCPTGKRGRQHHDLISHSVTLFWHWWKQCVSAICHVHDEPQHHVARVLFVLTAFPATIFTQLCSFLMITAQALLQHAFRVQETQQAVNAAISASCQIQRKSSNYFLPIVPPSKWGCLPPACLPAAE